MNILKGWLKKKDKNSVLNGDLEEKTILIPNIGKLEKDKTVNDGELNEKGDVRPKKIMNKRKKKWLKITAIVASFVFIVVAIIGALFFRVYVSTRNIKFSIDRTMNAVSEQNISKINSELENTKTALNDFSNTYKNITWLKVIPYFGGFITDGEYVIRAGQHGLVASEIAVDAIDSYDEIIGLEEGSQGSAQDRLDFAIKVLPAVTPKIDDLADELVVIRDELKKIDTEKYPDSLFGFKVRSYIESVINAVDLSAGFLIHGKPLMEATPYILGSDEERTYLILFQNDKELRPTGGFMTAYAVAKVRKGIFEPVASSDIYNLDDKYTPAIPAPEPIIKHLRGPYLETENYHLRDMNWMPDFADSMELFIEEAQTLEVDEIGEIDGVIAVDTQLMVYLLDAVGPIDVAGYGSFSTDIVEECGCPQVIYELESFADIGGPVVWSENEPGKVVFAPPNYDNRKKIIGPLMNSILSSTFGQSNEKIPLTIEALLKSINEKHILLWMRDEETQLALEQFGVAGELINYQGDYLLINDANLGGRKSNLYVTSEIEQEIEFDDDGSVVKTVIITYRNPVSYDGWLNSVLPNYVRVYVPKGSELISLTGVQEKEDPYVEYEKTVFAGFFELNPEGAARVTLKYKLPFKVEDQYSLYIQKQPGTDAPLHTVILGDEMEEIYLKSDKEIVIDL
jgi:hypothetical protein